jgi:membrane dipeptidase
VIVDGHEDLAINVLADGRDYLTSAAAIRAAEAGTGVEDLNGTCMLGLADWLRGEVGVIVATVTAIPRADAGVGEMSYATVEGAHEQALAQLAIYRRWEESSPQIVVVRERSQLDDVLASWAPDAPEAARRIGLVLLIENADVIRDPDEVAFWADQGVRMIGPAWHTNRYSGSSRSGGPLTPLGRRLLEAAGRLGLVVDVTHMSDEAATETLRSYDGFVVATHANSRRSVPGARLLSDEVVKGIVAREGVVGVLPLNWALKPGWKKASGKASVTLDLVVDAVQTICEVAGDVLHVGIGTDFDGGQGAESAPAEIDTIGDLPKLASRLAERGFEPDEVTAIMSGNWLRLLRQSLPGTPSTTA